MSTDTDPDGLYEMRRRKRDSAPTRPRRTPAECLENSTSGTENSFDRSKLMEELQQLKSIVARVVDRIEEALTNGQAQVQPTGTHTHEGVMQLWGQLTWPIVLLGHVRSKSTDWRAAVLNDAESVVLKQSIEHALHAERVLNKELRVTLGLSQAFELVESSIFSSTRWSKSVAFDRACASLSAAVQQMQKTTGIYIDKNNDILGNFNSLQIVAHLRVAAIPPTSYTPDYSAHETSLATHFTWSDKPADLVLISLRKAAFADELVHAMCHESSMSLGVANDVSQLNVSCGVMFSDASTGMACLATSVLDEFGIELDEVGGSSAFVSNRGIQKLFDCAFSDVDATEEERRVAPKQHFSHAWDATPDVETDFGW